MKSKRLLHVLGGGPWQVPTVRRAKEMGYHVLVTDMYSERPAYAYADEHQVVDITDFEGTLTAARRFGIDGILCDTTDVGVATAAYVAEQLRLPGIGLECALNFTNKARMREVTSRCGIVSPPFARVARETDLEAAVERVGLPLVMKPVDNQSGRGVTLVHDAKDMRTAFEWARQHSRAGEVLLDGYLPGVEYIVDGFVVDGKVTILGIAPKIPYSDNKTLCSRILYLSGVRFDSAHEIIAPTGRAVVSALGLRNGIFHSEFIVRDRVAVPIDVAARGGGVMIYWHALPHVSGVDVMESMVKVAMGEAPVIQPRRSRRGACIEFFRAPLGRFSEARGTAEAARIAGVAAVHINVHPGSAIGALTNKDDRPGFVVALGADSEEAVDIAAEAKSRIRFLLDGDKRTYAVT